jgi:hypothetical protein
MYIPTDYVVVFAEEDEQEEDPYPCQKQTRTNVLQ